MIKRKSHILRKLFTEEDTPMDAAERAAIAKLIEWDKNGKTEFHNVPESMSDYLREQINNEVKVYDI